MTSHCTLLCGNSTIYVKPLINWKLLWVGNRIKTSGSSGWCEYFNVNHVPNRWIVTHIYVSLARRSRSKTVALPKINPSRVRYSIRRRLISNLRVCRNGCEVGLDFYERAERASNDHNFQAIDILYITLHMFRVITQIYQTFLTSHCTLLCGNSTIHVKP